MRTWLYVCLCGLVVGCTPATKAIVQETHTVDSLTQDIDVNADAVLEQAEKPNKEDIDVGVLKKAGTDIKVKTKEIRESTAEIRERGTDTQDTVHPIWQFFSDLSWLWILGILIVVLILLKTTAVGEVIRKIMKLFGFIIPSVDDKEDAVVLRKAHEKEISNEQLITYFRAKYPEVNKAWKKSKPRSGKE